MDLRLKSLLLLSQLTKSPRLAYTLILTAVIVLIVMATRLDVVEGGVECLLHLDS